ncbi:NUDIX hydrolase [Tissierella creatinophila]|uniref:Diadenosine hexaphosphate hydrolase n=1 Tax=Tissierella creatinophila DSM 6911 TaxID=1123403 RepID=A0A1U7M7M5_TISCR|nr:NUDIX hydrolase [Tissierella creatinophila]OLS03297.1 diadenosine hexaphosphate hydrolase [Tissierella creatinophila DSM 6911]
MRKEISSGGVVIFGNTILLLKKYNGDWVLPKGRVEKGETLPAAALREVQEETGVKANIIDYIGEINYKYKSIQYNEIVSKIVYWYQMESFSMECRPQRSEGFISAKFIHQNKVLEILKYKDEREIIKKFLKLKK